MGVLMLGKKDGLTIICYLYIHHNIIHIACIIPVLCVRQATIPEQIYGTKNKTNITYATDGWRGHKLLDSW